MAKGELACDPRGLILEAYRMQLTPEDARTIFLDWALGPEAGEAGAIAELLAHYAARQPDHPMSAVLRAAAAETAPTPGRRGGYRARRR
ncbi:hypothetical protein [Amaricoccus sp.]|mgnify:CR=1 FL=1|uniref:hypothetical protein n=1 Tax=Amaricoccus sp. TaxID=1872485 RepID=UPI0026181341|nr:hypothetical protein [Amaricoccus sp.]HRO12314.1 hypothetical protein [Amaricoccus sp.]